MNVEQVLGRPTVHPFPARMAPGLAVDALSNLRYRSTVLDPMVGSGTVAAVARAHGHRAIGFDVDPLAVLSARVWTRTISRLAMQNEAQRVLARAIGIAGGLLQRDAYPVGADSETRAFIRYWFDDYARIQLAALAAAIATVPTDEVREFMWCSFSRQIVAKQAGVSLAMDLAHSRPHRAFRRAPRKPFRHFIDAVHRVIAGCVTDADSNKGPVATIRLGDVRQLPIADRTIDLVFTSPPYLNAIDYLRCSKFSLVWMGYSIKELREIRAASIGAEVGISAGALSDEVLRSLRLKARLTPRSEGIVSRYIRDTHDALRELSRVLAPEGRIVYVVGENMIRGTYIPTGKLVAHLASMLHLRVTSRHVRDLPDNCRYLPPPGPKGAALDARIRREVILAFEHSCRSSRRPTSRRAGHRTATIGSA